MEVYALLTCVYHYAQTNNRSVSPYVIEAIYMTWAGCFANEKQNKKWIASSDTPH